MKLKDLNPKKILIINNYGIGDVLFTTPFIKNLKLNFPNATLGFLCNRRTESIVKNINEIEKIHIYERDEFKEMYHNSKFGFLKKLNHRMNEIKNEQYDVVFDFSLTGLANYMMWYIGIKHRIGFNFKNRSPFLTYKVPLYSFESKHVADHYLDLLEEIGCHVDRCALHISSNKEDLAWAEDFVAKNRKFPEKKLIGVVPGGGASWGNEATLRRWSTGNFAKLVDKIIENYQAEIILFGDKSEEFLTDEVVKSLNHEVIVASGKTTLNQFITVLKHCDAVVLNDGGPLHMGVAAGVKTVSIFGPVDEQVYGPYGPSDRHRVVKKDLACRPCYRRFRMARCNHISCLKNINIEDVLNELEGVL